MTGKLRFTRVAVGLESNRSPATLFVDDYADRTGFTSPFVTAENVLPMSISDRVLESFLDESLPADESAVVEQRLRDDPSLLERLSELIRRRDLGDHSLGAIWQRNRVTCADRSTLGAYLLGVLDADARRYWDLHLNVVECRYCRANLDDMRLRREEKKDQTTARRRRFYESSVGRLKHP